MGKGHQRKGPAAVKRAAALALAAVTGCGSLQVRINEYPITNGQIRVLTRGMEYQRQQQRRDGFLLFGSVATFIVAGLVFSQAANDANQRRKDDEICRCHFKR